MEEIEVLSCTRGYHVYKDVWTPAVGETLVCQREPENANDRLFIRVKNFCTLSLKRNLFTDEKKANYGILCICIFLIKLKCFFMHDLILYHLHSCMYSHNLIH